MIQPEKHDLLIIGGGPAGLTAALSAEDNGIDTLVIDASTLGGQAATATLIENYPGFPEGISGDELISRIVDQALKYTTEFEAPSRVTSLVGQEDGVTVTTEDDTRYTGSMALLATGQEQRLLKARNLAAYTNRGVTYGSPDRHVQYEDRHFIVVGGSDAAAQAAVHLSGFPGSDVHMLLRSASLAKRARTSLIDKVAKAENIHVHPLAELVGVDGTGRIERATIKANGHVEELLVDELFVLIGSQPRTTWLPDTVLRDRNGYVLSGSRIDGSAREAFLMRTNGRQPYEHETSMPRLFVAGDVRSGLGKMVTFAALDGSSVVPELQALQIHDLLHGTRG